jgi:uncharacterized membrane protein YfcA
VLTATGSFQITGYTIQYFHQVCSISVTGLVTANSGTYLSRKVMQQDVHRCIISIVVFNVICVMMTSSSIGGNVTTNDTLNGAA